MLDADLFEELSRLFEPGPVDGQGHEVEVVARELGFELVEGGHLFSARCAPRRPQVEQNHLALPRIDGDFSVFAIHETNGRQILGLSTGHKCRHRPRCIGTQPITSGRNRFTAFHFCNRDIIAKSAQSHVYRDEPCNRREASRDQGGLE